MPTSPSSATIRPSAAAERRQRLTERSARRDLLAKIPGCRRSVLGREPVHLGVTGRRRGRHDEAAQPAELLDRRVGILERLAVKPVAVLHGAHALALDRARDDRDRLAVARQRLLVGVVDLRDVVAVDLERAPPERLRPPRVGGGIPAQHRLAALAEAVDVDDRDQVVQRLVAGVVKGLPDRTLGHLAVATEHPDPVGQPIQALAGERDPDGARQALPQRSGGDIDPRDLRRRMTLEPASELSERQQLVV